MRWCTFWRGKGETLAAGELCRRTPTARKPGRWVFRFRGCQTTVATRWRGSQVVRHGSAKPLSAVRFRSAPPTFPGFSAADRPIAPWSYILNVNSLLGNFLSCFSPSSRQDYLPLNGGVAPRRRDSGWRWRIRVTENCLEALLPRFLCGGNGPGVSLGTSPGGGAKAWYGPAAFSWNSKRYTFRCGRPTRAA